MVFRGRKEEQTLSRRREAKQADLDQIIARIRSKIDVLANNTFPNFEMRLEASGQEGQQVIAQVRNLLNQMHAYLEIVDNLSELGVGRFRSAVELLFGVMVDTLALEENDKPDLKLIKAKLKECSQKAANLAIYKKKS